MESHKRMRENDEDSRDSPLSQQYFERIVGARDWYHLFQVKRDISPDDEEAHRSARAVRNRLVRVMHPDRASTDAEKEQMHTATQIINAFWEAASKYFAPPNCERGSPGTSSNGARCGTSTSSPRGGEPAGASPRPTDRTPERDRAPSGGSARNTETSNSPPKRNDSEENIVEPGGALDLINQEKQKIPPTVIMSGDMGVGIGSHETLQHCCFVRMATNRCVSQDVVAQRVTRNLAELRRTGKYCDFGHISLAAIRAPSSEQYVQENGIRKARFFVLDGQHRLETLLELRRERPNAAVSFAFSVKIVGSKEEANAALLHIQNTYRADPSCFFYGDFEADIAARVLDFARVQWQNAFAEADVGTFARQRLPAKRPEVEDGIFFDFLRDSQLLSEAAEGHARGQTGAQCAKTLFEKVMRVNEALRGIAGEQASQKKLAEGTFRACREKFSGCFLGLYRNDDNGRAYLQDLQHRGLCPRGGGAHGGRAEGGAGKGAAEGGRKGRQGRQEAVGCTEKGELVALVCENGISISAADTP